MLPRSRSTPPARRCTLNENEPYTQHASRSSSQLRVDAMVAIVILVPGVLGCAARAGVWRAAETRVCACAIYMMTTCVVIRRRRIDSKLRLPQETTHHMCICSWVSFQNSYSIPNDERAGGECPRHHGPPGRPAHRSGLAGRRARPPRARPHRACGARGAGPAAVRRVLDTRRLPYLTKRVHDTKRPVPLPARPIHASPMCAASVFHRVHTTVARSTRTR